MMAPGFKPVGWVAAVAVAAIGCYMLSLNVASERAELARVEHQIVMTKQQIRTLQTELGTRGRLAQLEQWNAEVLALSAPTSAQFLGDEMMLARFDKSGPSIEDRAAVRMASATTGPVPDSAPIDSGAKVIQAAAPAAAPSAGNAPLGNSQLVRKASLQLPSAAPSTRPALSTAVPAKPAAATSADRPAPPKAAPPRPAPRVASRVEAPAKPAEKSLARLRPAAKPTLTLASAKPATARAKPSATSNAIPKPEKAKPASRLDDRLASEIGAAARAEARAGGR